jgi:hypothetical protein
MAKFFNTIKSKPTDEELKYLYQIYVNNTESSDEDPITYKDFIKNNKLNLFIDMKCLYCHYEVREPLELYSFELEDSPFPMDWCPDCMKQSLVPKDIHSKLIK